MHREAIAADTYIAREFAKKLEKRMGSNLKKAVLFGSRAKGISKADSDYDLLLVLKKRNHEIIDGIYDEVVDFLNDRGIDISLKIYTEEIYNSKMTLVTPFMAEIKKTGISL